MHLSNDVTPRLYSDLLVEISKLKREISRETHGSKERISNILTNMKPIIKEIKTISYINTSINSHILSATKIILFLAFFLTLVALLTSANYHHNLHKQDRNFGTANKYFNKVIFNELVNDDILRYTPFYSEYRYEIIQFDQLYQLLQKNVFCAIHKMIMELRSSSLRGMLCNLNKFPKMLEEANMEATPDSFHSIIMLSISTFLWATCIALQREILSLRILLYKESLIDNMPHLIKIIEKYNQTQNINDLSHLQKEILTKKQPKYLSKALLNSIFLGAVNIFGIYAFKSTKIAWDSYWAYIWSITVTIIIIIQFLSNS